MARRYYLLFHPFELMFAESSNKVLVGAMRLERITYGLKDRYSNHLSYTPTEYSVVPKEGIEPSRILTID